MKANYKEFAITTKFVGGKAAGWDEHNRNYHVVTVKNTETGKRTRFDFWCSIAQPTFEAEYDVLNAFYCFVSDALSGADTFAGFCGEFGYDTDSRNAEKIYKACKRSFAQFQRVSGYCESEMCDFINELSEIAG